MSNSQLKARLRLACVAVLAAGLCTAAILHAVAEDDPDEGASYILVNGVAYPVPDYQTKRYVRTLEQYGGKASVVFDDLGRWFAGLWHGRKLGVTIAWLSAAIAAGLFLFARWLPTGDG